MSADSENWPSSNESPGSLTAWREKLDFLLKQEVTTVDPDQKFQLKELIAEAKAKLAELENDAGTEAAARVNVVRLPAGGRYFVARDDELRRLDDAWADDHVHAISIVAWGGVGKSALVDRWLAAMERDDWRGARRVYGWSFYSQGTEERLTSADAFIDDALRGCCGSDRVKERSLLGSYKPLRQPLTPLAPSPSLPSHPPGRGGGPPTLVESPATCPRHVQARQGPAAGLPGWWISVRHRFEHCPDIHASVPARLDHDASSSAHVGRRLDHRGGASGPV